MPELILASASPRRAELLRQAGFSFSIRESTLSEETFKEPPPRGVELLALEKAGNVAGNLSSGIVLGADTVVIEDGIILGKPGDKDEAIEMLRRLSGNEHTVITAIALIDAANNHRKITDHVETRVWMRKLHDDEISAYAESNEPYDKAGAYGIQGYAAVFIRRIEGCYFNVVGLPLSMVCLHLSRLGIKPSWD